MLSEGLYGLDYQAAGEPQDVGGPDFKFSDLHQPDVHQPDVIGSGLAVLRAGKIIGTDCCGSVFFGACEYDRQHRVNRVSVRLRVPPGGELVTGVPTGSDGAMFDIVAAINEASGPHATVEVAGRPVTVKLTYIGPLPH